MTLKLTAGRVFFFFITESCVHARDLMRRARHASPRTHAHKDNGERGKHSLLTCHSFIIILLQSRMCMFERTDGRKIADKCTDT